MCRRSLFGLRVWMLLATTAVANVSAQDYTLQGPFEVRTLRERVRVAPMTNGAPATTVNLDVIVTYPSSQKLLFPIIAMFNGFQTKADWYSATAGHVASWGYITLQYTIPGLIKIVTIREELTYLPPLLGWLAAQGSGTGPLSGILDISRLATFGHSRGGKLAALHYAGSSNITTAVLLDPVDSTSFAPESADYPSAIKALAAAKRTAGVVGAGITSSCNPANSNYAKFFSALAPGSWQMVILQAGHAQFSRSGNAIIDNLLDVTCRKGTIAAKDVIQNAASFTVAWLESVFRSNQAQTQAGLQNFQKWLASQQAKKIITYSVKAAPA